MLRLTKKKHDHDPKAMRVPWECISPSCKDEDVEDYLKHPDLFMSKATWKIIKNGEDAVGGEDCFRQLAITSCEEYKGNILQTRARMVISEETGERIINAARGARDRPHCLEEKKEREASQQTSRIWQSEPTRAMMQAVPISAANRRTHTCSCQKCQKSIKLDTVKSTPVLKFPEHERWRAASTRYLCEY
ncbi:hypothetical protein LTR56_004563 [Elasticomyces elasticus]|nr:hypothetical protein LTR56_004563 [Elasticomyces elasticus]KAK3659917.1 hypothetical protein LTR22_008284 [Elasticomyces elasticus]KAK4925902.1 hypothetical protein LTR49_007040 [Elasticomyces elasticus]KAK5768139.1 hypothetical protein LTS12_001623 [Elasticomyces elasticus]